MSEPKQKHIRHLYDTWQNKYLAGPLSSLIPSGRSLQVVFSDGTTQKVTIAEATTNITDNLLNGMIDVVIRLRLEKGEEKHETNCL